MKAAKTEEAITLYRKVIDLDADNHVLCSYWSAAYVNLKKYQEALEDAEKTIQLKPDWPVKLCKLCYVCEDEIDLLECSKMKREILAHDITIPHE